MANTPPEDPAAPAAYDRRAFLRRAGLATVSLAAAPTLGVARPAAAADDALAPFVHGVASGDPHADSVVLWTRLSDATTAETVTWEVATDVSMANIVASGTADASPDRNHTVRVIASGLQPATWYFYRFTSADGLRSLTGRTKTAPSGAVDRLRFGVVSCSSYQHGFFNSYARLAERDDLDAILCLGDYLYEYQINADGGYGHPESALASPRNHEPPVEMTTLDHYRVRHGQYKLDPDLRRLHQLYPWVTTWDDHESTNNSARDEAGNHTESTEGDWQQRKAWAKQAYNEWMPIRADATVALWRSLRYGDLADLIVMDTRLERDREIGSQGNTLFETEIDDPDRIMISPAQKTFVYDALGSQDTTWKILVQQVIMGQWNAGAIPNPGGATQDAPNFIVRSNGNTANPDQWDGYTAERANLFARVREVQSSGTCNLVTLTGDVHTSWALDLTEDPEDPLAYNPATGDGSLGAEFVCTSVTSPSSLLPPEASSADFTAIEAGTRAENLHVKYTNFRERGYMVLDVDHQRAQSEWYYVDTELAPSDIESFGAAWFTEAGNPHVQEAAEPAPDGAAAPATPTGQADSPDPETANVQSDPAAVGSGAGGALPATGGTGSLTTVAGLTGAAAVVVAIRRRVTVPKDKI